ncbi:MAG: hypothetical protein RBU30_13210 [Polyangia bacterium]|jgi:hypothetical protein|nr:hypothetical protein [Polyangia bacterium]
MPRAAVIAGLFGLSGCQGGEGPGLFSGAYQVANGTRRVECEGQVESAPFASMVWFHGQMPLRRLDDLSFCEFRFGVRQGSGEVTGTESGSASGAASGIESGSESGSASGSTVGLPSAEILPGQVCLEWRVGPRGVPVPVQVVPISWTVRPLPGRLLWESYELLLVEGQGKEARRCRLSAAATLAPVN